jgi:ADP-ribosyl-[dinitrogen reductase] hydrolase
MKERAHGALLGLAVGDALGTTYEFEAIEQAPYPALATAPATDVVGGGPFGVAPGAITDDTQMAVCLARSLAERGRLDIDDVAQRYSTWSEGAFDIGNQTRDAIGRIRTGTPAAMAGLATWQQSGRRAAGNGSLMRTAPIAVALSGAPELYAAALADSLITHADPRCAIACAVFDAAISAAITKQLDGAGMLAVARRAVVGAPQELAAQWRAFAGGGVEIGRDDLRAIESAEDDLTRDLEAATADDPGLYTTELHMHRTAGFVRVAFRLAFWHCVHTPSWRDAVVDTASRGGDADTNTAIVGALLGARDGVSAIPEAWRIRVLSARQNGSPSWAEAHHPKHLLALAE